MVQGGGDLLGLTLYGVGINAVGVHAAAVAHQGFQLAFGQVLGNADKGVPKLVQAAVGDAVVVAVGLPSVADGAFRSVCKDPPGAASQGPLGFQLLDGQGREGDRPQGVWIFALGDGAADVPGAVQPQDGAVDVAPFQPQQLTGAHPGEDRQAVIVDEGILDRLAPKDCFVAAHQDGQAVRLQNPFAPIAGAGRDGQLVGMIGGVAALAGEFQQAGQIGIKVLQGLFAEARSASQIQHVLQVLIRQGLQLFPAQVGGDPGAPAAFHRLPVALGGGELPLGQVFRPDIRHRFAPGLDPFVQPVVRLGVGLPLAGAAGLEAVEAAALAVLLDIDLPAAIFVRPDRRVGASAHTKTSFGYGLTDPTQKRYNRSVTAAR